MGNTHEGVQEIRIRPARPADAERLAALCTQLGYPASPDEVRRRLEQIRHDVDNAVYVAEPAGGQVMGWMQVYARQLLVADRHAELGGLVVDAAQRRHGLGRRLMEEAEAWARARGCEALYLRSNVVREGAHRFYEGIGYTAAKTQYTYHKPLSEG